MKYHKTALWKQHPNSRKSWFPQNLNLLWLTFICVMSVAGLVGVFLDVRDGEGFGWLLFVRIFGSWAALLFSASGILVSTPSWRAKVELKKLGTAILGTRFFDESVFASRSVADVQSTGKMLLDEYASSITALEWRLAEDLQNMKHFQMVEFLKQVVDSKKSEYRSRMSEIYNAMLEFRLVKKGGIDQFFKKEVAAG